MFWKKVEGGVFTGAITGAIFGGLGGAGQLAGNILGKSCAFAVGLFAPDCAFVRFNQKLHSSKLYNGFQMGVSAIAIFSGGMRKGMSQVNPACFVAGTMILTAMGLVAIENIKAGDKVISTDPETMETGEKTVLETYIREVTTLVHLTVNGEEIVTTVDHPFYVKDQGFVNAGELVVGNKLLDSNGNILFVEDFKIELTDEPVKVYNFQVEDFHTYHVSRLGVLVHNADYITENHYVLDIFVDKIYIDRGIKIITFQVAGDSFPLESNLTYFIWPSGSVG